MTQRKTAKGAILSTRCARPEELEQVRALFQQEENTYTRIHMPDLDDILSSRLVLVAAERDILRGALISIWPSAPRAWIDGLAVDSPDSVDEVYDTLLSSFEAYVGSGGVKWLYCSLDSTDNHSVRAKMLDRGFELRYQFLRYQREGLATSEPNGSNGSGSNITVRDARWDDWPHLCLIEQASFEPPWRVSVANVRRAMERHPLFKVALVDGVVAGFQYCAIDGEKTGYIIHAAVNPRFRRMGVGRRLVTDAMSYFEQRGVTCAQVRTERSNTGERRLLTTLGFQESQPGRDVLVKEL